MLLVGLNLYATEDELQRSEQTVKDSIETEVRGVKGVSAQCVAMRNVRPGERKRQGRETSVHAVERSSNVGYKPTQKPTGDTTLHVL